MESIRKQPEQLYRAPAVTYAPQAPKPTAKTLRNPQPKGDASTRDMLKQIINHQNTGEQIEETRKTKQGFKWPAKWKSAAKKSSLRNHILVFYLNIKGELEPPRMVPLYAGHMVVIQDKVHEIDPRSLWTTKIGTKMHKLVIIREIDRRPVSNLDWDEIRRRGDATDSDEFLIKAALKAQVGAAKKPMSKGVIILLGIAAIAGLIFFMSSGA